MRGAFYVATIIIDPSTKSVSVIWTMLCSGVIEHLCQTKLQFSTSSVLRKDVPERSFCSWKTSYLCCTHTNYMVVEEFHHSSSFTQYDLSNKCIYTYTVDFTGRPWNPFATFHFKRDKAQNMPITFTLQLPRQLCMYNCISVFCIATLRISYTPEFKLDLRNLSV